MKYSREILESCLAANNKDFQSLVIEKLDLSGIKFDGIDASGGSMGRCKLQNASFRSSRLIETDFGESDLQGADFTSVKALYAHFEKCKLSNSVFLESELEGTNFSDSIVRSSNFKGSHIDDAIFQGAELTGTDFSRCSSKSTNFLNSNLDSCKFNSTIFDENTLKGILLANNWKSASFDKQIRNRLHILS
jgi:uncharacterized protein YjbI with pentapeptide repeats